MKRLWSNLGENRKYFALTLLVAIIYAANSVTLPTVSGNLITAVITDFSQSADLLVLFIVVSAFQIICSQLNLYMGNNLKIRQKRLMRQKAFRSFSVNDAVSREEQAGFVSFVNNDIPGVAEQYFLGTIDITNCICIILFSAASLLYIHWVFALIIIGISFLIVYLPKTLRKRGGEARKNYSDAMAQYNSVLQSFLGGLRILKTYQYHKRANQLLHDSNEDIVKSEKIMVKQQLIVYGMTTCLQVFKTISILSVGAVMVYKGIVEVGGLITIIQLAELIGAPIEVLAYLHHSRNEVLPLLKKYEEMTLPKAGCLEKTNVSNVNSDTIILEHVSYKIDELQILKDISVKFSEGKKYLITGASGSGKSTLLRLISQIGDSAYNGRICYGGTEIRDIDKNEYFNKVCPVFQEPYLFHATLEENILLGRQIENSIYYDVIEKLNLKYLLERYEGQEITPEVMELLSGGEKQRVALARAMVGKPLVYLLDEVTSALDKENAYNIEELLLKEEAMVIHISHQASSKLTVMYDEHFVLEEGMLFVQGNITKTH